MAQNSCQIRLMLSVFLKRVPLSVSSRPSGSGRSVSRIHSNASAPSGGDGSHTRTTPACNCSRPRPSPRGGVSHATPLDTHTVAVRAACAGFAGDFRVAACAGFACTATSLA